MLLDAVDRQLLGLLAKDGRLSQRALAGKMHMSPPAVRERVARLERAGVIRGYGASIEWSALGYLTVYLAVTALQGADQGSIMEGLDRLVEVEEVVVITGSMDMLARVRVRDYLHLRQFLLEHVWQIEGVQRTETFLVLAENPQKDFAGELLLRGSDVSDTSHSL